MKISSYWFANFVYDFILYAILAAVALVLVKVLDITSMVADGAFGAVCVLFIFYGIAYIWFTYIFAFVFKDYGNAQAGYFFMTYLSGGMLPLLPMLLRILSTNTNLYGRLMAWVLRLYPSFAFG